MITTKTNRTNTVIQYRFSLVEILVAISIIAILLGLSGAGYTAVQRKIARTRTEATLNKIRVGLESYKSKFGYYPQQVAIGPFQLDINDPTVPQGQPQNNFNVYIEYGKMSNEDSVMIKDPGNPTQPFTYTASNGKPVKVFRVIDGWKTNIRVKNAASDFCPNPAGGTQGAPYILYVCPGLLNTSSYDLFSAGNDRTFIWRDLATFTDMNDPVNADNIWPQGLKQK